jgi:acyl dehydratase
MSSESDRSALLDTWTETSSHVFDSVVAANRAAFAAFGVEPGEKDGSVAAPTERIEPDEDLPEWHTELTADDPTKLAVGDRFEFTKTITDGDVKRFAASSGDTNPLHLDGEFAEETRFKGRIAHGTLVGGLISAALARVPGMVIYLSQDLEFHNPVRIDDRITAECEIVEDLGNNQYRLNTRVRNGEDIAIDGEAVIMVDELPEAAKAAVED